MVACQLFGCDVSGRVTGVDCQPPTECVWVGSRGRKSGKLPWRAEGAVGHGGKAFAVAVGGGEGPVREEGGRWLITEVSPVPLFQAMREAGWHAVQGGTREYHGQGWEL